MSREALESGIRTIVEGVAQLVKVVKQSSQGSPNDLKNSAKSLIQGLKDLVSRVLAPNGHWRAPNLDSTAQALKSNILLLVQRAKEAYGNSSVGHANLEQQAKTTIYSAKQIVRVWQSSVNNRKGSVSSMEPPANGGGRRRRDGAYSVTLTGSQAQQAQAAQAADAKRQEELQRQKAWQQRKSEMETRNSNRRSKAYVAGGAGRTSGVMQQGVGNRASGVMQHGVGNRASGVMQQNAGNTRKSGVMAPRSRGTSAFSGPAGQRRGSTIQNKSFSDSIKQKYATHYSDFDDPSPAAAVKKREALIRQSRKSISLARQSVHQLFGNQGSGNEQNGLLLQKVLQQISMMEQQMQRMESDLEKQRKNPQAFSNGAAQQQSNDSMMQMMEQLQRQMKEAESERMKQLEERELIMREKEKKLELLLSGLDMEAITEKLQKVQALGEAMDMENISKKLKKIDALEARMQAGDFGGGPIRAYDELKKTVEDLQKLIFADDTPEKERAAANIELEKAMKDLERCPEFIQQKKEAVEKWRRENEPLNAKAYNEVISRLRQEAQSSRDRFRAKMEKCGELQLLLLKKDAILRKHESDFTTYVLNVSLSELRALYHHMPKFRSNQRIQLAFVQTLENKIKEKAKNPVKKAPPPVKRTGKKFVMKKAKPGGGGMSFLDELKKKRQKLN